MTEGTVTEVEYFDRLRQELSRGGAFVQVKTVGVGKDPLRVLYKCIEFRDQALRDDQSYDWSCCVVDVDTHTTLDDCVRQAKREAVHLVISNIKFEVWLLWHVVDSSAYRTGDELDQLMQRHGLTDGKHLLPHFPIDKYETAARIARLVDPAMADHRRGGNPSTSMPLLLDMMQ